MGRDEEKRDEDGQIQKRRELQAARPKRRARQATPSAAEPNVLNGGGDSDDDDDVDPLFALTKAIQGAAASSPGKAKEANGSHRDRSRSRSGYRGTRRVDERPWAEAARPKRRARDNGGSDEHARFTRHEV